MAGTKLPEETVVRIVKCLGHGCSVEATADICEVAPRTVERLLEKASRRLRISTVYNWTDWKVRPRRSSWMSYTAGWPNSQKKGQIPKGRDQGVCSAGSHVGSYRLGGSEPLCHRFACRAPHFGNCLPVGCFGSRLLWDRIASVADRRSFALSSGHSASLWPNEASPKTQERSWPKTQACSQAAPRPFGW